MAPTTKHQPQLYLALPGPEQLSRMQIIAMLFTGAAPLYLMSTTYVLVGALLGCPMGAEFKSALQAAWQVSCMAIEFQNVHF